MTHEPHSLAPPTDIEEFAMGEQAWARDRFIGAVAHMPLDALLNAVHQAADMGLGTIHAPPTSTLHRPGTHLFEIDLFGVRGAGESALEAARSWRRAAMRLWAGGEA